MNITIKENNIEDKIATKAQTSKFLRRRKVL